MINSDGRKLSLSGWLKQNYENEYNTPLKLQKFLLFYESFSKVDGEEPEFEHLKGYKRGPVFSQVWGDYTKEREAFNLAAEESLASGRFQINEDRAKKSAFVVSTLSEAELSDLTHNMNLWNAKKERILSGEYQVALEEKDFNEADFDLIRSLEEMYPIELIDNSSVISLDNHYFVFRNEDRVNLTEAHFDLLETLANTEKLHNPIYVELDEEGRLLVD